MVNLTRIYTKTGDDGTTSLGDMSRTSKNDPRLEAYATVDGVRICENYSCGAVQVASFNGCTWWEVNAKLVGQTSPDDSTQRTFGTIQVLANATKPKQIITILLISQELLTLKHVVRGISIKCHHNPSACAMT